MEKKKSMSVEQSYTDHEIGDINKNFDDDGREKRSGNSTFCFYLINVMIQTT